MFCHPSLEVLQAARAGADQDALEGSAVAETFLEWIRRRVRFVGTSTELLDELNAARGARKPPMWPKTAWALSGLIRRTAPNLRRLGVSVVHSRVGHGRVRTVTVTYDPAVTREPAGGADDGNVPGEPRI